MYHINRFSYVEAFLHPRDKSHLVMGYDPFNVLMDFFFASILLRSFAYLFIRDIDL